jgi:hypothetical protein
VKPTPTLTTAQAIKVATLKRASPSFVVMRRLATRFRGLLRSADPSKLDAWHYASPPRNFSFLQQFARTLSGGIGAAILYQDKPAL